MILTKPKSPNADSKPAIHYPETIIYPESDGKPMGETDWHIAAILYLRQALRYFFGNQQVYVAADLLFYYEEGDTSVFKVPDVMVVKGIDPHDRRVYKLWEEERQPNLIIEITSKGTRWDDLTTKKALYEYLAIQEYFIYDPLNEYLTPNLQGFHLVAGQYQPMDLDSSGGLHSQELGLRLQADRNLLRLFDPATKKWIPTMEEAAIMAEEAARRADKAETENSQLREELEKLRRGSQKE